MNIVLNFFEAACGRACARLGFKVGQPRAKKGSIPMLEREITNEQEIEVTLAPVTATGRPAPLDGTPGWEIIGGNSATLHVAPGGLSAVVRSTDTVLGDTDIRVTADADLGDGVEEISDILRVSVTGARARNLGLTVSAPRAKPDPA